ncbi:MAG: response regulator transcription factor [Flavobacteriia bacterium]|nr:response regulator transcription factor [Flavobacteriia bacterium]
MEKIYLALADDHQLMRNGFSMILETIPQFQLLHSAKDGKELIDMILSNKTLPDVVFMDIDMPIKNGFEACKEINEQFPEVHVLFLTNHISKKFIETAILSGGNGYLAKDSDIETIIEAINEVIENGFYFNEYWTIDLLKNLLKNGKIKHQFEDNIELTTREIEVLRAICEEKTDAQIGDKLNISHLTAESYRKSLLKKIGVKKAVGLAIFAVKNNII